MKQRIWKLSESNLPYFVRFLEGLDKTKKWEIVVREAQSQRTVEQNNRLWALYESIADFTGYSKADIHRLMGSEHLIEEREICGVVCKTIKSTTELNTKQMSEYQEKIEAWGYSMLDGWSFDD